MKKADNRNRIFCVGMARSGTHSINSIFENHARSMHEPENKVLINYIIGLNDHKITDDIVRNYLKDKDHRLQLEIDSSQLNFFILDLILGEFINSKFILTIRDCFSWIDSFINHSLAYPNINEVWIKYKELRFGKNNIFPPEELILMQNKLFPLDSYFQYWAYHNQKVIDIVPKNRLLIIRTDEISDSVEKLEDFSGIRFGNIHHNKTHVHENPKKFNILKSIDKHYLQKKSEKYCHNLMSQYFPDKMIY